jgi:Zn finger protein HypA/HybF involved in hydrogenase expression
MLENNQMVKCSRCKNQHLKSEREYSESDKYGMRKLICPKCGASSFSLIEKGGA